MSALPELLHQTRLVALRSARHARRDPVVTLGFPVAVPLLLLGMFSQMFAAIADVAGFPTDTYGTWLAPGIVLLGSMSGKETEPVAFLDDIRSGYLDRLRLVPVRPAALLAGRLAADAARGLLACAVLVALTAVLGTPWHGGAIAVAVLTALFALWTLAYSGLFFLIAIGTRSTGAVTAAIPLLLPVSMLSSAYLPDRLMPAWLRWAAGGNPFGYVVDAVRTFTTDPWHTRTLLIGLLAAALTATVTVAAAAWRFHRLIATTE
jgi:ABC-2 type transport system permease protein